MDSKLRESSRSEKNKVIEDQESKNISNLKLCSAQVFSNSLLYLILFAVISIFLYMERSTVTSSGLRYGVIIDAGSSGTRVHVSLFTLQGGETLNLEEDHYFEVKQSLSMCFQNSSSVTNVGYVFSKLLSFVRSIVPEVERPRTPIFLKATAGLRLMDTDMIETVLDATRGILVASEFSFEPSRANVIDGVDESLYGWITVNSLMSTFSKESHHTFGILDLGGGSLQIAYDTNYSYDEDESIRELFVADKTYHVYSQSFLGMGLLEFRRRIYKLLEETGELARNPCFYSGATERIDVDGREQSFVNTSGTGDFDSCLSLINDIFTKEFGFDRESRKLLNTTVDTFIAFAYFFDRIYTFGLASQSSRSDLEEVGRYICSEEWHVVQNSYASVRNGGSEHLCFDMAYIYFLLYDFLEFDRTGKNTWFLQTYHGKEFGWSLGALFHEMNLLLLEKEVL